VLLTFLERAQRGHIAEQLGSPLHELGKTTPDSRVLIGFAAGVPDMLAQSVGGLAMLGVDTPQVCCARLITNLGQRLLIRLRRGQLASEQRVQRVRLRLHHGVTSRTSQRRVAAADSFLFFTATTVPRRVRESRAERRAGSVSDWRIRQAI